MLTGSELIKLEFGNNKNINGQCNDQFMQFNMNKRIAFTNTLKNLSIPFLFDHLQKRKKNLLYFHLV